MSAPALAELLLRHRVPLAVAGAIALATGAWMAAAAYAAPRTHESIEERVLWTESAAFTYRVPVTRNSTHWPLGTELPMGQPAYFRTVSDSILVSYAWDAHGPERMRGVAAASLVVEVRAQTSDGRPYWSIERPLAEASAPSAAQGIRMEGRLDLDVLVEEASRVSRELPLGEGVIQWTVRATVVHALDLEGAAVQGRTVHELPIEAVDPRFVLPAPEDLGFERAHTEERVTTATAQAGADGVLRSPGPLALAATGGALLAAATAGGSLATGPFERERRKYRDWVSVAEHVPDLGAAVVDVGSLEDLVQVASDARTRVLLDAPSRVYYALLPGVTYRYARHASDAPTVPA